MGRNQPGKCPSDCGRIEKFLEDANGNESLAMRAFAKHIREKAGDPSVVEASEELERQYEAPFETAELDRDPPGFWNDGGRTPELGADEQFDQDEIPTKGHRWLDLQRDIREWQRYAIWELPLLSSAYRESKEIY
jgi:hypothetical protein